MKSLHNALSDAFELSESLYNHQSTFFLGAGFSKDLGLPSFWELVRNRILPGFIKDLVQNGTDEEWIGLLDIAQFKPKNCLECFINSYVGGLSLESKKSWPASIQKVTLSNLQAQRTLSDVLQQFQRLLNANKMEDSEAADIIHNLPQMSSKDYETRLEQLKGIVDDDRYSWSNSSICLQCIKSEWNHKDQKDSNYILGLLQAYLDQGKFQIVNLLEFIQYSIDNQGADGDGKIKIAEYAFKNNPDFKRFDQMIEEYHRCPEESITDSQIALARLSKEGLIHQIITTNWDDLMELACYAIDMYVKTNDKKVFGLAGEELSPEAQKKLEYKHYVNHAVAMSEKEDYYNSNYLLAPTKKTFYLYKIHGGIDKILVNIPDDADQEGDLKEKQSNDRKDWNFVITHRDLADWRDDKWSRDLVNSILRSHDIIFAGISGGDNVIYATIRRVFEELANIISAGGNSKEQEDFKKVFAIDVRKGLVLSNMVTGRAGIKEKSIILDRGIKLNQVSGPALFYRFVYVFNILQHFLGDVKTYVRKMVEYLNEGKYIYTKSKETEELLRAFIEGQLFDLENFENLEDAECKLHLKFMDVIYDVIPKLIIYTWLLNNHLSSIRAETDNKNFLLKKPHFYLPVLAYSKWYTMYLLIFAKLYSYISNPETQIRDVRITQDGVIVLNGVAILFMITAHPHWENLRQIGTQAFSKQSLEVMNRSWKKAIIIWDVQKGDGLPDGDQDIMNHQFTPYSLGYEDIFQGFDEFMNRILSIEEEV